MLSLNLKDQKVLVTGATRGIGRSIAVTLAEAGADVAFTYTGTSEKSNEQAKEVAAEIENFGSRSLALKLNLAEPEGFADTFKEIKAQWGGLDGLVNNAGIVLDQLILRYKKEDLDKIFDVNVKGTFLLTKDALRLIMKSENPSIVNLGSVVGLMGNAGQCAYSASKAALVGFSKSLARELSSRKVRVNLIAPGYIDTDMTSSMTEEQTKALTDMIPLGCVGKPEDIAYAVSYLLSPLSRYVTGQVLNVNGGMYM